MDNTPKNLITRETISKVLLNCKKMPEKQDISPVLVEYFSAMCYAPPCYNPHEFEYICPVCKQKTIFSKDINENEFQEMLDSIHEWEDNMMDSFGFQIVLDIRFYCAHCRPKDMEDLCWSITLDGKTFHVTKEDDDMELLTAFFRDFCCGDNDNHDSLRLVRCKDSSKMETIIGYAPGAYNTDDDCVLYVQDNIKRLCILFGLDYEQYEK